jgi:ABC-type transporter Mla maintaining outer membrane lipid asymmetry permease subunit MlaE
MIFSKDSEFLEALESAEAVDRRLVQLQKLRRLHLALHIFGLLVFFFCTFVGLQGYMKVKQTGPMPFTAMLMLLMALHQLAALVAAQNEIRTLLAFKRLRQSS